MFFPYRKVVDSLPKYLGQTINATGTNYKVRFPVKFTLYGEE